MAYAPWLKLVRTGVAGYHLTLERLL
jgi:hypothetical protein